MGEYQNGYEDGYKDGFKDGYRKAIDDFMGLLYHEAFETDTELQKWDSGCWIRFKLAENVADNIKEGVKNGKIGNNLL